MLSVLESLGTQRVRGMMICAALLGILFVEARADTAIDIKGTFVKCYGRAKGVNYDVTNKTKENICDFTVDIEKKGGGDPGAKMRMVDDDDGDGDPDVGVNWDFKPDFVKPNATSHIIKAATDADCIPRNNNLHHDLNIRLTGFTTAKWCVIIQPTDKNGNAIGESLDAECSAGNFHKVTLGTEMAQSNRPSGLAFSDVNSTGAALTTLYLSPSESGGFSIIDAYQKDVDGNEIGASVFNPGDGSLTLGASVADGNPYFFAVNVDSFVGGAPMDVVVAYSEITDPTGACCFPDGNCVDGAPSTLCGCLGGTYEGNGTTCLAVACPVPPAGACCMPDGTCDDDATSGGCAAGGGVYEGDGTTCAQTACSAPTGACCAPDGTCGDDVRESDCLDAALSYEGDGTTCGVVECLVEPLSGACCTDGGSCQDGISPEDCQGSLQVGETCAEGCPAPIPTASEWGLIVMTVLVLTAGTVLVGRRRPAAA